MKRFRQKPVEIDNSEVWRTCIIGAPEAFWVIEFVLPVMTVHVVKILRGIHGRFEVFEYD